MLEQWRQDGQRLGLQSWVCEVGREARNEDGQDRKRLYEGLWRNARLCGGRLVVECTMQGALLTFWS